MSDIVRVVRVIEYVGPRDWINAIMQRNYAPPEGRKVGPDRFVRELAISPQIDSFVTGPNSLGNVV